MHEWQQGRWQGAEQLDSPNFSPREAGSEVSLVVLHNISLPPFEYGSDAVQRLFTNRIDPAAHPFFAQIAGLRVSSHFFIARSGRVQQFVSCDDAAPLPAIRTSPRSAKPTPAIFSTGRA